MGATPTKTTPTPPQIKLPALHSSMLTHELHLLRPLWPLAVLLVLAGAWRLALNARQASRLRRAGMPEIDRLDGQTFELKLGTLFRRLGYGVELVGRRGDFGADLLLERDGRRTVVQAKRWSKNVGIDAVNQVVGARGYYAADDAMVVTNHRFTKAAREQARPNGVTLWDRERLIAELLRGASAPSGESPPSAMPSAAPAEVVEAAHCARCGKPVSQKVRDYCLKYPKRFAGLVYCYEHQRALGSNSV